ncbi:cholesterol 25-hydroxylase-like [Glandiceps talaboti]
MGAKIWQTTVWILRILCLGGAFVFCYNVDVLQKNMDDLWEILRHHWFYRLAYFETFFVVLYYTSFLWIPFAIDYSHVFDRFKLEPKDKVPIPSPLQFIVEVIVYVSPLAALDTIMVKKYAGVTEDDLVELRKNWIQTERILPKDPPDVRMVVFHLIVSLIIYDFLIFIQHYMLHRNRWLYDNIHACHHNHHRGLHIRVTNNLNIIERVSIVLTANFALKVIGSHPFTRTLFIPFFVTLLSDSHMGYDFPWSYDKILPMSIMGGAKAHHSHHISGTKNFQPFFTYIDKVILKRMLKSEHVD